MILAGPCVIIQVKNEAKDGYNALQLGFGDKRASRTSKPLQGHFSKSGGNCYAYLREVEVENPDDFTVGSTIGLDLFKVGERVDVVGTTKGRGYAGVMKRHGFGGGRKTHGSKSHRIPGSIGCSAWPAKVIKGKKLPGHYGNERKTVRNLEIVDIRPDQHLILIKGAIPGHRQAMVEIKKLKFVQPD
jgi:large subunit ribosomal protein L3